MALTAGRDLFLVVHAGALDCTIFFLVPAPEPAGTVGPSELGLVADKTPDDGTELFFIRIKEPAVLPCVVFCPLEHFRVFQCSVSHGIGPGCVVRLVYAAGTLVFAIASLSVVLF